MLPSTCVSPCTSRHSCLSSHECGICHGLLSAAANLAQTCGSCRALSSLTWVMLSKSCSTLHPTSLAAVCKGAMYYMAGKEQASLKTLQKVMDVGKSSEGGALFPGRERKQWSCLLCTASGLWEELTVILVLWVCFTIQFRSLNLHLLLSILFCMCDLGECMWILNFVGHRPVTLVFQDSF